VIGFSRGLGTRAAREVRGDLVVLDAIALQGEAGAHIFYEVACHCQQ
jgi:hypothetical protein